MKRFFSIFLFVFGLVLPVGGVYGAKDAVSSDDNEATISTDDCTHYTCSGSQTEANNYCIQQTNNRGAYCGTSSCIGKCVVPSDIADGCDEKKECTYAGILSTGDQKYHCKITNVGNQCLINEEYDEYQCGPNRYSNNGKQRDVSLSALDCRSCPNGGTSSAGSTSVNNCTGGSTTPTCTASSTCGGWVNKGKYETRSCTKTSTNCSTSSSSEYRCAAGYYANNSQSKSVSDDLGVLNCARCPKIDNVQSTSNAGGFGASSCCLKRGVTGEDSSGPFVIESDCCAS